MQLRTAPDSRITQITDIDTELVMCFVYGARVDQIFQAIKMVAVT